MDGQQQPQQYGGRSSLRQLGTSSRDSSETGSKVDNIEAEYIRDMMKKRRASKEAKLSNAVGALGNTFQARLLALRMAVRDYDLPMQLAYDELEDLAANTDRVRAVVVKNMSFLNVQMKRRNFRYYKSAFTAFRIYAQRKADRRIALRNAADYYHRRMLGRAFQAWYIVLLRMQKFKRLEISATKMLRRQNLARIWRAWSSLVKRRLREDEKLWREKQLVRDLHVRQRECVAKRAVNAIRRRRLQRAYFAFKIGVGIVVDTKKRQDHIFYIVIRRKATVAFKFWERYPRKRDRDLRAIRRRERKAALNFFLHWEDEAAFLKFQRRRMNRCRLIIGFRKWIVFLLRKATYDTIVARVTRARLRRYFGEFREICQEEIWKKRTCERATRKCRLLRLRWFFEAWITYMKIQERDRSFRLEQYAQILELENQKTRSECDRLGRIIDTGEWDQQRIDDLEQASQILSGEKEALLKLAARLEGEHAESLNLQGRQELEIKHLKDEMLGNNFVKKNKLLVKGASSFNSVLRAVKSEAIKQGVNPEVVSSVDEKSMDQVSVFPDGDLRIKPLNKFKKGRWMTPEDP